MFFPCSRCRATISVPDSLVGQYVICWNCSAGNDVPDPPELPYSGVASDYGVDRLECIHCGYSVVSLTQNRCPECGRRFDPHYLAHVIQERQRFAGRNPTHWLTVAFLLIILLPCLISVLFGIVSSIML